MKGFLWSSTGDLTSAVTRFESFWAHQAAEINARHDVTSHRVATFTLKPMYLEVREKVTAKAKVNTLFTAEHRQLNIRGGKPVMPRGQCDEDWPCNFKASYGLPCRHDPF
ncbi:hypothetical protein CDD80_2270 [Ophiocordyceps camponoti-rufipedis]|uniref:Uncharacterized protein n=1 Tax=Ophiocordyceps camponoti-rufipedis TaxID=2004952 RepID=A0A2C5ZGU9_9HYPO|nr:hypothetical protein CDD80_2270 [Ophiocordyceps camponoti-rufipedis]